MAHLRRETTSVEEWGQAWALAQGEASAEIERRRRRARTGRQAGRLAESGVDDQPAELVRLQVAPLWSRSTGPDYIVAGGFGEAEMREGVREAREVIAVEGEERQGIAPFEPRHQEAQHLVGAAQPVEIAQEAGAVRHVPRIKEAANRRIDRRPLFQPRPVIAH